MARVVTAFAVAWFALVQPAAAHASRASSPDVAEMCEDGSQSIKTSDLDGLGGASYAGAGLANVSVSTEDPDATTVSSGAKSDRPDKSPDGPAWCISPDDPRCAPRDTGSSLSTHRLSPLVQASAHVSTEAPVCRELAVPVAFIYPGCVLAGVERSLERPPQA